MANRILCLTQAAIKVLARAWVPSEDSWDRDTCDFTCTLAEFSSSRVELRALLFSASLCLKANLSSWPQRLLQHQSVLHQSVQGEKSIGSTSKTIM